MRYILQCNDGELGYDSECDDTTCVLSDSEVLNLAFLVEKVGTREEPARQEVVCAIRAFVERDAVDEIRVRLVLEVLGAVCKLAAAGILEKRLDAVAERFLGVVRLRDMRYRL